jgi:hypothetical protein
VAIESLLSSRYGTNRNVVAQPVCAANRFSNIKCNNSLITICTRSILDETIDFFESFNCTLPTQGIYEIYSRPTSSPDLFESNKAHLINQLIETHAPESEANPVIPVDLKFTVLTGILIILFDQPITPPSYGSRVCNAHSYRPH